jgi:hypothetical protein
MRKLRVGVAVIVAIAVFLFLAERQSTAFAGSLSDITPQWWQLMYSIPPDVNPIADTTGEHCMMGQRGPTWFLGGVISGGTAIRNCSVPAGEALFFPWSISWMSTHRIIVDRTLPI